MVTIKAQHDKHPPITLIVDPLYLPVVLEVMLNQGYELIEVK